MRKHHISTSATSKGTQSSFTKSSAMVQVSEGTAERIPVQIFKHTEQIAHKHSAQNL